MTRPPKKKGIVGSRWGHELMVGMAAFREELASASDRVAVIMAVAGIDRGLEMLLRHRFMTSSEATQEECDWLLTKMPIPPLGSAGVRVRLARCLGLIDRQESDALLFAIEWRNHFAHEALSSPITEEVAQGLLDRLPTRMKSLIPKCLRELSAIGGADESFSPRRKFTVACMALQSRLIVKADIRFGDRVPGERED